MAAPVSTKRYIFRDHTRSRVVNGHWMDDCKLQNCNPHGSDALWPLTNLVLQVYIPWRVFANVFSSVFCKYICVFWKYVCVFRKYIWQLMCLPLFCYRWPLPSCIFGLLLYFSLYFAHLSLVFLLVLHRPIDHCCIVFLLVLQRPSVLSCILYCISITPQFTWRRWNLCDIFVQCSLPVLDYVSLMHHLRL